MPCVACACVLLLSNIIPFLRLPTTPTLAYTTYKTQHTGISGDASALTEALEADEVEAEFGEGGVELLAEHGEALSKAPKGTCLVMCFIVFL